MGRDEESLLDLFCRPLCSTLVMGDEPVVASAAGWRLPTREGACLADEQSHIPKLSDYRSVMSFVVVQKGSCYEGFAPLVCPYQPAPVRRGCPK